MLFSGRAYCKALPKSFLIIPYTISISLLLASVLVTLMMVQKGGQVTKPIIVVRMPCKLLYVIQVK